MTKEFDVVTGALGFTGRYIAKELLDSGREVRTLTNSINRDNPFNDSLRVMPFSFDNFPELVQSLRGASVLYNTYWVRFDHKDFTHLKAVENTAVLLKAAKEAGVKRVVHISVTNPSETSPFPYFRGKAMQEKIVVESGIPYVILRPALIFGAGDILINNIAWMLRSFPVMGIFGKGDYKVRPVYAVDLARLAVSAATQKNNTVIDAVGPEVFTYKQLVETIGTAIGRKRPLISIPPAAGYLAGLLMGSVLGDVVITMDEIKGLMAGMLYVNSQPAAHVRMTDWMKENSETLGVNYAADLKRRVYK